MSGDLQAVRRVGPAAAAALVNGLTPINAAARTPAAVNGSATWTIPAMGAQAPGNGCYVTITNTGLLTTDLLVVAFSRSLDPAAGRPNAATATDFTIMPGATGEFWCDQGVDTVKFGGPVTAIASHYRSSI